MKLQALPKTEKLTKEINHLIERAGATTDEVTLARWVNEAQQLINNGNQISGYILLFVIAVFRRDVWQLKKNYQQAITKKVSDNPFIYINYFNCLTKLGYISADFDIVLAASKIFLNNLKVISESIDYAIFAGQYQFAQELIEKFHKLSPNNQLPEEKIVAFAQRRNLNEAEIQKYISIAMEVFHHLQNPAKIIITMRGDIFADEESEWIQLGIWIDNISVEELADITFNLCDALAEENFSLETTSQFLVSYHLWERIL